MRGARHHDDNETEQAAARDRHRRLAPFLAGWEQLHEPRRDDLFGDRVARRREDLAKSEQANRDRYDADTVAELRDVEGVAEMSGEHIDADHAEHETEARHQQGANQ